MCIPDLQSTMAKTTRKCCFKVNYLVFPSKRSSQTEKQIPWNGPECHISSMNLKSFLFCYSENHRKPRFYLSSTVSSSSGAHRIVKLGSCWGGWGSQGQNPSYHAPGVYRMCRDYMRLGSTWWFYMRKPMGMGRIKPCSVDLLKDIIISSKLFDNFNSAIYLIYVCECMDIQFQSLC